MIRGLRVLWLFGLALLQPGCGGSSPTAPPAMTSFHVTTSYGTVKVEVTSPCATTTEAEVAGEILQGYRRAIGEAAEAASVPVEPLLIYVMAKRDPAVWFDPPADRVEYGCGNEGAIEHEMGHRIAHYLGRSCVPEVWHTVDLNCSPL